MNFTEFQMWREQKLRELPGALDCAETNLYRSLEPLQPKPPVTSHTVYRCDLARAWLRRYQFDERRSRQALVCRGVRHALELIFQELAQNNDLLWVPSDVYPVYFDLARTAGIKPRTYHTLPQPEFPREKVLERAEFLLAANPWKPLGRFFTDVECAALEHWLDVSPNRHLLLDCVYDLGAPFHLTTQRLLNTGRTILLHSVTKGWLWPKTFGVALLNSPHPQLEAAFRNAPPSQDQLRLAERLLTGEAELPATIISRLAVHRQNLLSSLPISVRDNFLCGLSQQSPGNYFFTVSVSAEQLLSHHNIIGVPASAFGAEWSGTVLTSLAGYFQAEENGGGR